MYEKELAAYFEAHKDEFLEDLAVLVAIPSVKTEPSGDCPYGRNTAKALSQSLSIAEKYDLYTENWENYVGIVQIEPGRRMLDILAHLDVVAPGDGWEVTKPYTMKISEGKVYGRGTADDKGPALAALYALRAIKDLQIPLRNGVRLVLGTDEESGSSDLLHYFSKTGPAAMSFSPDAVYPVINVEKGRLSGKVTGSFAHQQILEVHGGHTTNIIPDSAYAVLQNIDEAKLTQAASSDQISYSLAQTDKGYKLTVHGVSGHAASPEASVNPITALLQLLSGCTDCEEIKSLCSLFPHGAHHGQGLHLDLADDVSGELTLSLTLLDYDGHSLSASFDSRVPICASRQKMQAARNAISAAGFSYDEHFVAPHAVPDNTPFINTLLDCYESFSGRKGQCLAIGGGTYAHGIENAVAFGCAFGDIDNHMHGADEFAEISTLLMSCNIFAQAIIRLCGKPSMILPKGRIYGTVLWLQQADTKDASPLFQLLSEAGIAAIPVIVDKNGETAENLEMVENVLADIQANGALSALPVAVSGIGYGGFIAGHLLARKNCFAAGAIISGLTNPATAYGTCKGITLSQNAISDDFSMMDHLSRLTKESVVYHCDDIHTPLLLLHGFHDEIYGFEQAEQLFTSIKERQPQSEIRMVVFPTGDDNLAEDPDCKEKYFEELISWFMKYLKGETHDES